MLDQMILFHTPGLCVCPCQPEFGFTPGSLEARGSCADLLSVVSLPQTAPRATADAAHTFPAEQGRTHKKHALTSLEPLPINIWQERDETYSNF